jgi:hypothetical protein
VQRVQAEMPAACGGCVWVECLTMRAACGARTHARVCVCERGRCTPRAQNVQRGCVPAWAHVCIAILLSYVYCDTRSCVSSYTAVMYVSRYCSHVCIAILRSCVYSAIHVCIAIVLFLGFRGNLKLWQKKLATDPKRSS